MKQIKVAASALVFMGLSYLCGGSPLLAQPGGAVLNKAGVPVKLITTRETQLLREADPASDAAPCPAFKFWYVLPPERVASRDIDDIGSLTRNGYYRVAANDSEGAFKGWISKEDAVEWHHRQAVQFAKRHGRQLGHFYPAEEVAVQAVKSSDVSQATHREPESSASDLVLMPLLKLKEVQVDEERMNLYEVAFMAGRPETAPQGSSGGVRIPGVEGEVTTQRVVDETTVDIVFVVDTTASMQPAIDQVKRSIEAVSRNLAANGQLRSRLRFGLVAYRDTIPDMSGMEYLTRVFCTLEQGKDHDVFLRKLGGVKQAGVSSIDYAEDVFAGVDKAMSLETMKWNPLGWKQIVIVGDASIKGPDHPNSGSQRNENNRTIAGIMAKAQAGSNLEALAQGGFVISSVRIHHPDSDAKGDHPIGDRQFNQLASGRDYNGHVITARGGTNPEDFSGDLTRAILEALASFDRVILQPGAAAVAASSVAVSPAGGNPPPASSGKTAADYPWPVLDILSAVGQGSTNGMQFDSRYATEFDADGNRVFVPHVFIRKGQILSFNSMLDLLQGQLEDAGDPGSRDVATILRGLQAVSATLNLSEPITADMPIDKFLNLLLGFPVKNPIFQKTIGDLAASSQTDYDDWVKGIKAQRDTLKALTDNAHIWEKLHNDANDRAAHAFIPLSDLP